MTNRKVAQLSQKYADTIPPSSVGAKFQKQRERLHRFGYDLRMKLHGILIGEMEHDIGLLRARGFDRGMLKHFIKLWHDLLRISKNLDVEHPYTAAQNFVDFVKNRQNRAVIDNLDFLAKHHLEKTNVDFKPGPALRHPEVRSLELIKELAAYLEKYMKDNPLLEVPSMTPPTAEIPLLNVRPEPTTPSPGQEAKTAPGIPAAKQKPPYVNPFEKPWEEEI